MIPCDMMNGGWSVVSVETFEDGTATGWSDNSVDTASDCAIPVETAPFGYMLGGIDIFGPGLVTATSKTYDLLSIPHAQARVQLDYIVLDSWDDEDAIVSLGGAEVYRDTFNYMIAAANICGYMYADHGTQPVNEFVDHSSATVDVEITSTLMGDAHFGVQNVRIAVK
jgi:hypothetical protein